MVFFSLVVDDACMGGYALDEIRVVSNSVIQSFTEYHDSSCARLNGLQNSRVGRGHQVRGGTKRSTTGSLCQVRLSAGKKRSFSQQQSRKVHEEKWASLLKKQGPLIFREVEIVPGCAVMVASPTCPDNSLELLGPGRIIRNMLGWSQMEKTAGSWVWLFRGALQGESFFSSLVAAGDWVRKGSYHTAWSLPLGSSCTCPYAYGKGPAVGPYTGQRCWPLLAGVWRAIAPLMKPWCAEGEVPTAANLNLYRGWNSCVGWHCDDEPLFGKCGDAKLIVSGQVSSSYGSPSGTGTDQHCVPLDQTTCFLRTGVACCLPTCAQGLSVPVTGGLLCWVWYFLFFFFGFFLVFCTYGDCLFFWPPCYVHNWVLLVCLKLGTSFGRCLVGALPL